jgi:DNA invertase Pin-like site-specific DNA recombinase
MNQSPYLLGYARVSTVDQNPALQLDALKNAGCNEIFTDHGVSGKLASRPELDRMLSIARPGDTVVVWKLDRLGRNTRNLLELLDSLTGRGIKFRSLTDGFTTEGPMGVAMTTIWAAMSQLESDLISERTLAALAAAKAQGRVGGRPRLDPSKRAAALQLHGAGESLGSIAKSLGIGKATVFRIVREHLETVDA